VCVYIEDLKRGDPASGRTVALDVSACLYVCPRAYLKNTRSKFPYISVRAARGRGLNRPPAAVPVHRNYTSVSVHR